MVEPIPRARRRIRLTGLLRSLGNGASSMPVDSAATRRLARESRSCLRLCEHVFVPSAGTILHADVDAFFAAVEQRDDPRLRGRPVIVGTGVVLAASYEAKALGIQTAMSGRRARRPCPQVVVVEPRMSVYAEASKAVFRVFEDTSPLVEGLSIDEAFLDVRGLERISGTPAEIAMRLRRQVRERVGLPVTVGVARTKFLAKVASGVAKPDGLLVVPPDGELAFLHPLPIERLWGRGRCDRGEAPRARDRDCRPGRRAPGGGAGIDPRSGSRPPPPRALPQPRSSPGARRAAPELDWFTAGARPFA
jgi:DNA polymerase IV